MVQIPRRNDMARPPSPINIRIAPATGIGEGLGQFGDAVGRLAEDAQARDAQVAANRELSALRSDWADRIGEMEEAAPAGADGFQDTVLDAFDEESPRVLDRVAPAVRPWLEEKISAERLALQERAGRFEATARLEKRRMDLRDTIGLNANSVRTDPTRFEDALLQAREAVAAAGLRPDVEREVLTQSDNTIAAAYIRGLNETDPALAKQILEGGDLDKLLTPELKNTLVNDNQVELRRMDAERKARVAAARWQVRDIIDLLKRGYNPGRERLVELEGVARSDPQLADDLAAAAQLYDFQRVARGWTPTQLQDWINENQSAAHKAEGVTSAQADMLDMADSLLTSMAEGLRKDPLSWAARAGVHGISPLELVGDGAAESMAQRRTDAEEIAAYYGISPQYMTDDEAAQAASVIATLDVDGKMQLAASLAAGFGERSNEVFGQFAEAGSDVFAHAGGLVMLGAIPAARDVFVGVQARRDGIKPPAATDRISADLQFEGAFALAPQVQAAHGKAAEAIYIARAQRRGVNIEDATTFDAALWERASQEAAGAVYVKGGRYGGIETYNGWPVVVPSSIRADQFEEVIDRLTDEDLAGAKHTAGDAFTADELEDAFLVSAGDGLYRIALTDPADGDPIYVPDSGGTAPFVLDLVGMLDDLAGRGRRETAPVRNPAAGTAR